ncbi:MAG: hypothetical protein CMJ46_09630 [Planctomyces sp.]|nr:hypothetical protein [Planctomyces sp.]
MDSSATWHPPTNPNVQSILHEAWADTQAGRFEEALNKHLWFHEQAHQIDADFAGVRLSTALSFWYQLGQRYPAAMDALCATRDVAEARVFNNGFREADFDELQALNRILRSDRNTAQAFERIVRQNPAAAYRLFELATPSLLYAEIYEVCKLLIEPDMQFEHAVTIYNFSLESGEEMRSDAYDALVRSLTNLFSTLVQYERRTKAMELLAQFEQQHPDHDWQNVFAPALAGEVRPPRG